MVTGHTTCGMHMVLRMTTATVGISGVEDQLWLVGFMSFDLGYFDEDEGRVEPTKNPFLPERGGRENCKPCLRYKVLPMSPERTQDCLAVVRVLR